MPGYLDTLLAHARQGPAGIRPRQAQPFEDGGRALLEEVHREDEGARVVTEAEAVAGENAKTPRPVAPALPPPQAQREDQQPNPGRVENAEHRTSGARLREEPAVIHAAETSLVRQEARRETEKVVDVSPPSLTRPRPLQESAKPNALVPRRKEAGVESVRVEDGVVAVPPPAAPMPQRPQLRRDPVDETARQEERRGIEPQVAPRAPQPSVLPRLIERRESDRREEIAPSAARTIEVHIGRIDVRAVAPARPERPVRPAPTLSLDDYLKQSRP